MFRVWGKDRLSDPWITAEFRFRWQAEDWAAARAFVLRRMSDEQPLITEEALEGRSRLDVRVNGTWEPYSAWEDPERRTQQIEFIEAERKRSARIFRVAIEDEPGTFVGI